MNLKKKLFILKDHEFFLSLINAVTNTTYYSQINRDKKEKINQEIKRL